MSDALNAPIPVLYIAPWLDFGGSDKSTIDWFRTIDKDRFRPSLITTQPSPNRWMHHVNGLADEVWALPDTMPGDHFPAFILGFIQSRGIRVVHIMNSRLAFNLLPDIKALPDAPAVVVQLHVEEEDRSGYVRYVTTRYGNLVDGFSISGHHLSEAMRDYDVPRSKRHVIHTGVDTEAEFNPASIEPMPGLEPDLQHILYPVRLTGQKDPLLMLDVAVALRARRDDFRIHVIGDGDLSDDVQKAVAGRGLEEHVLLHGASHELVRWHAACDVMLLTSRFEGIPCVLFEAMSMRLPIVAPALPGVSEVLEGTENCIVAPRDNVSAYADALERLLDSAELRDSIGSSSREVVQSQYSLAGMARAHEELYERLAPAPAPQPEQAGPPYPLTFSRDATGQPLVTVVVPCYNHGLFLPECLRSIREQDYPHVQVIVVDDRSTDEETLEVLTELDKDPNVGVLRMPQNSGPSTARNAAIRIAAGRYILPVDADNMLLPGAITNMVAQLQEAGAEVGYVYSNLQFFGNRKEYFEAPPYNLYQLLQHNYCDTCALIDRDVFDAGMYYPDDMTHGHEDWAFVLQLGARGVQGEAARTKTLLYRKQGFTRSDQINYAAGDFHAELTDRFGDMYVWRAPGALGRRIKSEWAPALSIVVLTPIESEDGRGAVLERLENQSCHDAELIVRSSLDWTTTGTVATRRIHPQLATNEAVALADAMQIARGRWIVAVSGDLATHLADPGFVERILRSYRSDPSHHATVLVPEIESDYPFRPAEGAAWPSAVSWCRTGFRGLGDLDDRIPEFLDLGAVEPLSDLARQLGDADCNIRVRSHGHAVPTLDGNQQADEGGHARVPIRIPRAAQDRLENILHYVPHLPAISPDAATWRNQATPWLPPESMVLVRHRDTTTGLHVHTNDRISPAGCVIEYDLGAVSTIPVPGTHELSSIGTGLDIRYEGRLLGDQPETDPQRTVLGHLEVAPLPLLTPIELARHPDTGQLLLLSGENDPLRGHAEVVAFLGWAEPVPLLPHELRVEQPTQDLAGLTVSIDQQKRRHRYAVTERAPGEFLGELGGLLTEPIEGETRELVMNGDGLVYVSGGTPPAPSDTTATERFRWALAPLRWNGVAPLRSRMRAVARRTHYVLTGSDPVTQASVGSTRSIGHVFVERDVTRRPLYSTIHPITADQLLVTDQWEAVRLGYRDVLLIGYIAAQPTVCEHLEKRDVAVPWASKFGMRTD